MDFDNSIYTHMKSDFTDSTPSRKHSLMRPKIVTFTKRSRFASPYKYVIQRKTIQKFSLSIRLMRWWNGARWCCGTFQNSRSARRGFTIRSAPRYPTIERTIYKWGGGGSINMETLIKQWLYELFIDIPSAEPLWSGESISWKVATVPTALDSNRRTRNLEKRE